MSAYRCRMCVFLGSQMLFHSN
uniref:BLTX674 n=1 Tax=Nephila pilipes TaxID=299642 RepID=A0A076L0S9_NEPPI|nr:BLTX674 [Nephila pilipes]